MSSESLPAVLAAAARRAHDRLDLLRSWVEVGSFSNDPAGVNEVGRRLAAAFALPGLTLEVRPGQGVGDHLLWRTPAWDARPDRRVLLIGHHDTVFPPGTFEVWELRGDVLRGPGVLDMKGGLLVAHGALAALADAGVLAELPVALVSVADEEIGSLDSRPWLEEVARGAAAALVFEAGRAGDAIITRRKGSGALDVRVHGRAAHAGNNHADGINAIWALARFVDAAQECTDHDRGLTVNVGVIAGGTTRNTVPGTATAALEFRFVHGGDGTALLAALDRAALEIGGRSGARFELTGGVRRPPLERTEASAALFQRYAACARAAGLGDGEAALIGGGSDANTVAALGVPVIDGLGPRGRGFHTHDEHIEVATVEPKLEALVRLLLELG